MNNVDTDQNLNTYLKSNDSTDQYLIHFRCPDCSKLYSSNPENIYTENPEYTCSSCETEFSVSLLRALETPEVVGVKKQKLKKVETVLLPEVKKIETKKIEAKSQKTVEALVEEFKEQPKSRVHFQDLERVRHANTYELLWQGVLGSYEDRDAHSTFIKVCKADDHLDFALKMYGNILKHNSNDRIASSFVAKMKMNTEVKGFVAAEKSQKLLTTSFYITLAIVFTGLALICMGLVFGEDKNLAGLGIALIFFTFAVKAFFQPRRPAVD